MEPNKHIFFQMWTQIANRNVHEGWQLLFYRQISVGMASVDDWQIAAAATGLFDMILIQTELKNLGLVHSCYRSWLCWSWVHCGPVASCNSHRNLEQPINLRMALEVGAGVPGESPHRHGESIPTPHRKDQKSSSNANHCASVSPNTLNYWWN